MKCITLDTTKALLGIAEATTTYDDDIEAKILIIDTLVRRITKNKFNLQIVGYVEAGSDVFQVTNVYNPHVMLYDGMYIDTSLDEVLTTGMQLEGTGLKAGSYIAEINSFMATRVSGIHYDYPIILMNQTVLADATVTAYTNVPIDLQRVIAKAIWWLIQEESTTIKDDNWSSRTVGPLSVSRSAEDNKIDAMSGMPLWFIKAFPKFQGGH